MVRVYIALAIFIAGNLTGGTVTKWFHSRSVKAQLKAAVEAVEIESKKKDKRIERQSKIISKRRLSEQLADYDLSEQMKRDIEIINSDEYIKKWANSPHPDSFK